MASQGPLFAGTVGQTSAGQANRLAWDQTISVQIDDGVVSTCAVSPATYRLTNKWELSGFAFTLPAGSVPVGIELSFECATNITVSGQCRDGTAELYYNGALVGQISSSGSDWTAGFHTRSVGGATNLWGWTPTYAQINDGANFMVKFDAQVASNNSAAFDWLALKVYYSTTTFAAKEGSGGAGTGGSGNVKVKPITGGGAGVGGSFGRKVKPLATGGAGVGGTAAVRKLRSVTASGGVGVGYTQTLKKFSYGGNGGFGVGGNGIYQNTLHLDTSGGAGVGGNALVKVKPVTTGGAGAGGAGTFYKRRPEVGSGGFGVGGNYATFSKIRFTTASGGAGVGGDGASIRQVKKFNGTGGAGVGGGARVRRISTTLFDGGTDPEDFDRSHRGPVTRRMVYEAIRKVLVNGPLNDYAVYVGVDETDMDAIQGSDNFAIIIPGSAQNDQGDLEGGGSIGTIRTDMCEVRIYSRKSSDQYPRSTQWDLRIDGAMERARRVRRVLNLEDLIDESGWLLLTEPMRATSTGNANIRSKVPQVGYRSEVFECVYTEFLG